MHLQLCTVVNTKPEYIYVSIYIYLYSWCTFRRWHTNPYELLFRFPFDHLSVAIAVPPSVRAPSERGPSQQRLPKDRLVLSVIRRSLRLTLLVVPKGPPVVQKAGGVRQSTVLEHGQVRGGGCPRGCLAGGAVSVFRHHLRPGRRQEIDDPCLRLGGRFSREVDGALHPVQLRSTGGDAR